MGDTRRVLGKIHETLEVMGKFLERLARSNEAIEGELQHMRGLLTEQTEALVNMNARLTFIENSITVDREEYQKEIGALKERVSRIVVQQTGAPPP